jgi:putative endonuclease
MAIAAHTLGQAGEDAALKFLLAQGYELVYRNYRHRRAEVDLIMRLGQELLVFVEVKTRTTVRYGYPEEFVTTRKQELFRRAAEQVQEDLAWTGDIRFDIIALTPSNSGLRIEHFADAFY